MKKKTETGTRQLVSYLSAHMPHINIWSDWAAFRSHTSEFASLKRMRKTKPHKIYSLFTSLSKFRQRIVAIHRKMNECESLCVCVLWRDHLIHRHRHTIHATRSPCLMPHDCRVNKTVTIGSLQSGIAFFVHKPSSRSEWIVWMSVHRMLTQIATRLQYSRLTERTFIIFIGRQKECGIRVIA